MILVNDWTGLDRDVWRIRLDRNPLWNMGRCNFFIKVTLIIPQDRQDNTKKITK